MIYRGIATVKTDTSEAVTRVCFVSAGTTAQAIIKICEGVANIYNTTPFQVGIGHVQSEEQLKAKGLSGVVEWRLFEDSWKNGRCSRFVEAPLFLTADTKLLHVWASLPLAGSREVFADSLTQPADLAWRKLALDKLDALTLAAEEDDEESEIRLRYELGVLMELAATPVFANSQEAKAITLQVDEALDKHR